MSVRLKTSREPYDAFDDIDVGDEVKVFPSERDGGGSALWGEVVSKRGVLVSFDPILTTASARF